MSVLQLVAAFERATGKKVPLKMVDRRPGDVAACYADPSLMHELTGWKAQLNVDDMCQDAWRWQSQNPMGYN